MKWFWLVLLPVLLAAGVAYFLFAPPKLEPIHMSADWWGEGEPQPDNDVTISPMRITIRDKALADWKRRVEATRFGSDLDNGTFEYGFQVNYMKEVKQHWLTKYNWKKHEDELNQYKHFSTKIEGISVHFLRAYPKKPEPARGRVLLLLHGWPGTVWEFMKILPMLTDPESYGGKAEDAFEVICPSLPGFGFSQAPQKRGFGVSSMARVFLTLMTRLGHEQFYVQGGDWGAIISSTMAQLYPGHLLGVHVNMIQAPRKSLAVTTHQMAAYIFPSLVLDEADRKRLPPFQDLLQYILQETGYLHIQATKPDTVAVGLNDSPVGLAAYIMEKFSTWTNPANRALPDGGLTASYTLDDLLTNVMIYWFTGTIGSSMRIYKEAFADEVFNIVDNYPIYVPAGLALFPHDLTMARIPRAFAEYRYKNILQYTDMPTGGHFAAMEKPKLLADDIFSFVRKVEKLEQLGP